ncbi:hypothetical protein PMIN06_012753 [Paraphaeosphaeria minitans]
MLDLSNHTTAPDFVVMSFYKMFGFPDLGALIVRRASSHILEHRKYFSGGTIEGATVFGEPWVARKTSSLHAWLEDGSIAIRSILALRCALDTHRELFGSMKAISKHTNWLALTLYQRLSVLRHSNGTQVCVIHKAARSTYGDVQTQGATIALSVLNSDGSWMDTEALRSMLEEHTIHVRTGGLCNPGGTATTSGASPASLKAAHEGGFRCDDVRMARISFGAMSTLQDVEKLAAFFEDCIVDRGHEHLPERLTPSKL